LSFESNIFCLFSLTPALISKSVLTLKAAKFANGEAT
jgi:hypothetical protein